MQDVMWFDLEACSLDYQEEAPFRFRYEATTRAPPARVFEILATFEEQPRWGIEYERMDWASPAPHGVGSIREIAMLDVSVKERFLAWEPGRRFAINVIAMSRPLVTHFVQDILLEETTTGGTRIQWSVYYTPAPESRAVHLPERFHFGRFFENAVNGLAQYADATPAATVTS
jgi:hypothetical protein